MKKRLIVLAAALLAVLAWTCFACAEEAPSQDVKVQMALSETEVQAGDRIIVKISVTNTSGKDFKGIMTLYDPSGARVRNFSDPVLKDGESVSWSGSWKGTPKNLDNGKIIYSVRFRTEGKDGETLTKRLNFGRGITERQIRQEDLADVLLYAVYRPNPSTGYVAVGCVDVAGNVWLAEQADVEWPCTDNDIREMLKTRRRMRKYENAVGNTTDGTLTNDAWFATDVPAMLDAIPRPEERPRKTGIDVGVEAVYGLRKNAAGEEESVLLGMAGSYMYENPSPDAQRLYQYMWRLMTLDEIFGIYGVGYAEEKTSPQGFRGVTVREFYGLADGELGKASVSAVYLDAEGGPQEKELTPEEAEELRALAERGMIIRKENRWSMPEDVLTVTYTDEQGKELGQIKLFSYTVKTNEEGENVIATLAAAEDGMYQTALTPKPVDVLTEEELRLITVTIEGVDYVVGKSTPRDLIRNGWTCFPEIMGVFTFEDPEMNNYIEVWTAGFTLDEPIISISCQFAPGLDIEYCGFDGIPDPDNPKDPDCGSFGDGPDPDEAEPETDEGENEPEADGDEEEGPWEKDWVSLTEWVMAVLGEGQEGMQPGDSICYPLSDGRFLYLYSNSSPIVITLSESGSGTDVR